MSPLVVSVLVRAPLAVVWEAVADLGSHPRWMTDAESLEFLGDVRSGVGTRMLVETRVGPLRTRDVIEVTGWEPGQRITVVHRGAISGEGVLQLDAMAGGTRLKWSERLRFPWWWGGALTALLARPVLRWVWRRNLRRFERLVEADASITTP
ncbi:MAG TPA: SRPBCC family protein [Acidimicrobiia bacterium]|nr:SRPBCC family protein [Acidimicrobiia bacterium]